VAFSPAEHRPADGVCCRRGKTNPATSLRSVGGMNAWAVRRFGRYDRPAPSGGGKTKPSRLSKGSPEPDEKRPFHMRAEGRRRC